MLDLFLLLIIVYGFVRGFMKGFVLEVASFVGIIIGIVVARMYSAGLAEHVRIWFDLGLHYAKPLAFTLVFIAVALVLHIIAILIDKFLKIIALGWLNKLSGALFATLKFVIVLSILANFFQFVNEKVKIIPDEKLENSILYHPVKSVVPSVAPHIFGSDEN